MAQCFAYWSLGGLIRPKQTHTAAAETDIDERKEMTIMNKLNCQLHFPWTIVEEILLQSNPFAHNHVWKRSPY